MLKPSDFNNAVPQFPNGSYASNPINPQYIAEPDAENYNKGTEPLQTLPAQWWNWFLNKFTSRFNKINIYVKNIFNELAQVLSIFNITPDGTEQTPTTSQLKTVFESCYPQYVKTAASLVGTETTVNGHPLSSNVTVTRSDLGLGTSATVNTGTAVGCIPTVGTALGTTNNNILVTDSTGKLKPSGITVGTAAGCDASCFRASNWVPSMLQRVEGGVIYCAWMECGNTLNITPVNNKSWINYKGGSACTIIGNGVGDNGYGTLIANTLCGTLCGNVYGNARTASYACQAKGPIPFDAAEEAHPKGACVRAVVSKGTTQGVGFRSRMAIGLMYCGGSWAHGLISVGCNDEGTKWDDFIFPITHGGVVITSATIGSQSVACATCATSAGVTCAFGLAVGRRNETMRLWSVTWDDGAVQCDIYKAICWATNDATNFGTMSIVGSIGCTTGETTSYTRALERYYFADCGHTYRLLLKDNTKKDLYATCTNRIVEGRIGGVY